MKFYIDKINSKTPLSGEEIQASLSGLFEAERSEEEIEGFLLAIAKIPITSDWLFYAAHYLRQKMVSVDLGNISAIDNCGTGGDQHGTFNFSTAAALLVAACGVNVAKHGNRSISSKCGSADLLEALKIPINLDPDQILESVRKNHFAFMMAPQYHPILGRIQKARRKLGIVTVFNFLGPLLNPARVAHQVIGISKAELKPAYAQAIQRLGTQKTWVLHGEGGLDEMSLCGKTWVSEVTPQGIRELVFEPQDAALRTCEMKFLKGGESLENAKILKGIFNKSFFGPILQATLWNAAASLQVMGLCESLKEGVQLARLAIEDGAALELLNRLAKTDL